MNNSLEIRDVHIPDGVSYFPLAYGWWIILISLIVLIIMTFFVTKLIRKSRKRYALKKLNSIDTTNPILAAKEISELLRRICNLKYKKASVLMGKDWINFLTKKDTNTLSEKAESLLLYAPFIAEDSKSFDVTFADELKAFCKNWIGENL